MKKTVIAIAVGAVVLTAGITVSTVRAQTASQPATPAPGYMIADYDIKDEAVFKQYMEAAGPLAPRFGGKVIVFNTAAPAVEGRPRAVIAIAEFPSIADARRFYDSPEYTAARRFRIASTEGSVVITEGLPAAQ